VTDAIELVRVVRINPEELDSDCRIELRLDDGTSLVVEVRDGTMYVDPEMNDQFDCLSADTAENVVKDWKDRAEAAHRVNPKQYRKPLEIDPKDLHANGYNDCRVVIGGRRGLELCIKGEVALEFWYHEPIVHIGHAPLGARLRSVALVSRASQRELVA